MADEIVVAKPEETPAIKPTPETTPKPEETKPVETTPKVDETPVTKPVETTPKPEEIIPKPEETKPQINVQDRINRMYARLQSERERRLTAEVQNTLRKPDPNEDTNYTPETDKALSRQDVEAIWDRKEKDTLFRNSETRVLQRHPDSLNEDGSFNMNSEFTRRYIDIGKRNQMLAMMENGPELAEAQVEKEMGFSYKKGRKDEANRTQTATNAHTGASTVAVGAEKIVKLSPVQAKIAARMGMTSQQYSSYAEKISRGDKRAGV